jgi:hypothetical protein
VGRLVLLNTLLVFDTLPLFASAIYNNLGPSNSFVINRDYHTNVDFLATTFVTTGGGHLGTIMTPIFSLNLPVNFGLYTNSTGQTGTLLEDWSVTVPGFPAQFVTLTSIQNPSLGRPGRSTGSSSPSSCADAALRRIT